ncbi:hypothetical protein NSQ62_08125 [Solibacillus sp. FSL H8-0523]|uniref:hypothetical protein n=1 Tax=Solibacillus sp. FSL H8-0523 TaxID=2954511 RepID=UPI003100E1C2
MDNYESKALQYAEKYGIIEYTVRNNLMTYIEVLAIEGIYKATVNLDTMEETRFLIKKSRHK